jgi:hypothetical protein
MTGISPECHDYGNTPAFKSHRQSAQVITVATIYQLADCKVSVTQVSPGNARAEHERQCEKVRSALLPVLHHFETDLVTSPQT